MNRKDFFYIGGMVLCVMLIFLLILWPHKPEPIVPEDFKILPENYSPEAKQPLYYKLEDPSTAYIKEGEDYLEVEILDG